jgi:hypothetical protein
LSPRRIDRCNRQYRGCHQKIFHLLLLRHSGAHLTGPRNARPVGCEPGISRFRLSCCARCRNDETDLNSRSAIRQSAPRSCR